MFSIMIPLRSLPTRLKHAPLLRGFAHIRHGHDQAYYTPSFENVKWRPSTAGNESRSRSIDEGVEGGPIDHYLTIIPKTYRDGKKIEIDPSSPFSHTSEASWILPRLTLRDMCTCPRCVDQSTRQRFFSTPELNRHIEIAHVSESADHLEIEWANDLPGFENHRSVFSKDLINTLNSTATSKKFAPLPRRRFWSDYLFRREVRDVSYEAYMEDDAVLYKVLKRLRSHGLLFLKNVPESPESVARIAERIGPLKNTFYGDTWDVRSVPDAKNVAYTSQNLGFHMDLLYMEQPPHLQFLHCIRSSANGGASLFSDSFMAIKQLYRMDEDDFSMLNRRQITFHYDHMDSHYYQRSRPLIELKPLIFGAYNFADFELMRRTVAKSGRNAWMRDAFNLEDYLEAVSWSPPFQAPWQLASSKTDIESRNFAGTLEATFRRWHAAAHKFNQLIHKKENVHERMMKPGECVLFDNRRVLHARKAFEVGDAGKERWLRGAYLDKDPYMSKMRVLGHRFQHAEPVHIWPSDVELKSADYKDVEVDEEPAAAGAA